jgi:hypothetical protein
LVIHTKVAVFSQTEASNRPLADDMKIAPIIWPVFKRNAEVHASHFYAVHTQDVNQKIMLPGVVAKLASFKDQPESVSRVSN